VLSPPYLSKDKKFVYGRFNSVTIVLISSGSLSVLRRARTVLVFIETGRLVFREMATSTSYERFEFELVPW